MEVGRRTGRVRAGAGRGREGGREGGSLFPSGADRKRDGTLMGARDCARWDCRMRSVETA